MGRHPSLFISIALVLAFATAGLTAEPAEVVAAKARRWEPVSLEPFADSIHHAVALFEGQRPPYRQYPPEQIIHIAENLLARQNPDGGWPKNLDWTRAFSPNELARSFRGTDGQESKSTLDNKNTWSQVAYLAQVYRQTGLQRYAAAAVRGLEYILAGQHASGGWRGSDVEAVTFNDDVMTGVLATLKTVLEDRELYVFVDEPLRSRVKGAYDRGLVCLLRCQIKVGNRLTAWAQQHDHESLAPIWARVFEPPAIVTRESVGVVRFLMSIDNPPPAVIRAVESAVAWFDRVKIIGLRIEEVKAEPVHFPYQWSDLERIEVRDSQAPPIWTRFYDLQTEAPIFCTRQRVITSAYTDLSRERRTGYDWYGDWPAELLEKEYPAWRWKWRPAHNGP